MVFIYSVVSFFIYSVIRFRSNVFASPVTLNFSFFLQEMRKNLPQELCFTQEGRNAEKVAQMLSHLEWLKVPKIYWQLSTDRVLTMEFCEGGFVDDVKYMKDNKIDLIGISNKISQVEGLTFDS